ncbi:Mg chelatase-like protein [Rathayibacter sp. AY1F3]|uniref:ATP-binding protein n=1 Tax=Rathayibacter sp. AY1F3 TaxID=2080558 RepID=UPI000CE8DBD4|nr:ATP-binding protein [Rathayibacter sp. AY1F3]PPG91568.1 Mg chelatase-like protein [Rathayibacter sp. AY1F3]
MGLGRTSAVGLVGFAGAVVGVEAHSADGTPGMVIIGLPDAALAQAKERVRSAAINSGSTIAEYKITVNLSPAAMPKHGSAFDLAIGLAALASLREVDAESVAAVVHIGELGLDGRLRSVPGVLPAVLAAAREGRRRVMVPVEDRLEAELVDGVEVIAVSSLAAAAVWHGAEWEVPVLPEAAPPPATVSEPEARLDLSDVVGNEEAAEAMVVAAAGGHHVFLLGPPGAGKTMLASRLPGILPDLDDDAALEATCMRSLVGAPTGGALVRRPPFESPHHSASSAAIVGGGSGRIRPGAVARATRGVLFLDDVTSSQAHHATDGPETPENGSTRGRGATGGSAPLGGDGEVLSPARCDHRRRRGDDHLILDNQRHATLASGSSDVGSEVELVLHGHFYCLKRGSLSLL